MTSFDYVEPKRLTEATALLQEYGESAAILAGGTDLINHIHLGKRTPSLVLNIKNIRDLSRAIILHSNGVEIGALTSLTEVAEHSFMQAHFCAVSEAAVKVGSRQIRNRGTLVGNICNASPAADTVTALLLFDAAVRVVNVQGERRAVPLAEFITGPGKTALSRGEMVESVFLPYLPPNAASTYLKLSRREGVDLATVGVAAAVSGGSVRIALGAVAPKAFRAYSAERLLRSLPISDEAMEQAIKAIVAAASPISDLRGSREYRLGMIEVLAKRAVSTVADKLIITKEDE